MSILLPVCLIAVLTVPSIYGHGNGARDAYCGSSSQLIPGHGPAPQSSDVPYKLETDSGQNTFSEGETISLTLVGDVEPFHGFLIQAESNGDVVGTITAQDTSNSKVLNCGGTGSNGLTHTNKLPKTTLTFQWQANGVSDTVTIYVTVVRDYSTYWTKRPMLQLTPGSDTETTTSGTQPETNSTEEVVTPQPQTTSVSLTDQPPLTTTTIPSSQIGRIVYDDECGMTKGCFVKCDTRTDCDYMVTWRDLGNEVQFEIFGKPDPSYRDAAWVAVGFSTDTKMGDDSVTECVYSNGQFAAFNSYNPGYSNRRLPTQFGLSRVAGSYDGSVFACSFTRQKIVPQIPEMFDLNQNWHLMYANGRVLQVPAWQLYMHSTVDLPPATAARVDFQSYAIIGSTAKNKLVKAHGCLMIIAWVLFTGIGIVSARYYKNVWGDKTFLDLKIWFQIHRGCMISAVLLDVIAFIIIFIEVKGYSEIPSIPGKEYLQSHPVLGIIVTLLCLANPIMALFRPGGDHKRRPIFNWAHWGVGMSAYILSAICICFGFKLGKSSTPDYAVYIMIVYVLYVILFDVVFEVMECMSKKERKGKIDGIEMSNKNGTDNGHIANGNNMTKETQRKNDKIKTMLLAVHIAFTGAFALVLVLVVALH
ncbi:DOMON domain-containing protein frrs1L [Mactra antiquata]